MKTYGIGSWVQLRDQDIDFLRNRGCVISPSAMIAESFSLCLPVHISPRCQVKDNVKIDKFTFLNWDTVIYPNVVIGAYCSIGRGVQIGLARHPVEWLSTHTFQYNNSWFPDVDEMKFERSLRNMHHPKTFIGSDVWIGNNALITSGVKIGNGSIIGAGAMVIKDVPDYAIVGGVPAKIIRYRFEEKIIKSLLATKWWLYNPDKLKHLDFNDISACIRQLQSFNDR